jgi:hypothetical protein
MRLQQAGPSRLALTLILSLVVHTSHCVLCCTTLVLLLLLLLLLLW